MRFLVSASLLGGTLFACALLVGCDSGEPSDGGPTSPSYYTAEVLNPRLIGGTAEVLRIRVSAGGVPLPEGFFIRIEDPDGPWSVERLTDERGEIEFNFYLPTDSRELPYDFEVYRIVAPDQDLELVATSALVMEVDLPVQLEDATAQLRSLTVTWTRNPNPDFARYILERRYELSGSPEWVEIASIDDEGTTSFADETVISGEFYLYRVTLVLDDDYLIVGRQKAYRAGLTATFSEEAREVEFDPFRNLLYVTSYGSPSPDRMSRLTALDPATMEVVRQIQVGTQPNIASGEIELSADGSILYVTVDREATVWLVDPGTFAYEIVDVSEALNHTKPFRITELSPGRAAVGANGINGGTINQSLRPGVALLDVGAGNEVVRIPPPYDDAWSFTSHVRYLASSPDGETLFVTEALSSDRMFRIDLSRTPAVIEQDVATDGVGRMAVTADKIFSSYGTVFDPITLQPIGAIERGHPILSPDHRLVYVLSTGIFLGDGMQRIYDAQSMSLIREVPSRFTSVRDATVSADGTVAYLIERGDVWAVPLD